MTKRSSDFQKDYNLEKIFLKILKNLLQLISIGGILYAHSGGRAQSAVVKLQFRKPFFAIEGEQT